MRPDVDGGSVLYGLGTLLGIIAVFYFGQEILLSLSPTVKATILFAGFACFLVGGVVADDVMSTVLTVLAGGTYIIFLGYTLFRFRPSTNGVFLLLAASSTLFVGLGYLLRERELSLTRDQGVKVVAGAAVIVVLLVAVDVTGPRATVNPTFQEQVNVSPTADRERVPLGQITLRNDFMFSRTVKVPSYRVCLFTQQTANPVVDVVNVRDTLPGGLLGGGQSVVANVTAEFRVAPPDYSGDRDILTADDYRQLGNVPVEQADTCSDAADGTKIVVTTFPEPGGPPVRRGYVD